MRTIELSKSQAKKLIATRKPTGRMVPCSGDAHKPEIGGMIDNCMICAPRWGEVEEMAPLNVEEAVKAGKVIPWFMIPGGVTSHETPKIPEGYEEVSIHEYNIRKGQKYVHTRYFGIAPKALYFRLNGFGGTFNV